MKDKKKPKEEAELEEEEKETEKKEQKQKEVGKGKRWKEARKKSLRFRKLEIKRDQGAWLRSVSFGKKKKAKGVIK